MKWEAKYTVERKDGRKEEKTEQIEARSIREASMAAHATIVRPLWSYRTEGGDERKMRKKVKRKAIETMFVLSFILTGCGIDSIFVSKRDAITWAIAVAVLIMCAKSIGGYHDEK